MRRAAAGYVGAMVTVSRHIDASVDAVYDVLADGWSYCGFVVGTALIRDVDEGFPAPGTKLHHAVGTWPVLIEDNSEVLSNTPGSRLKLRVRGWPLGEAEVEFVLEPDGAGTRVTMHETPVSGPGLWVNSPVNEAYLKVRGREILRRLELRALGRQRALFSNAQLS
jgi:Polyketide cyclase / dehydrase and lipid transport